MSSLYFKKPPGLYISSGDWNDPANWFDEKGNPVDRVPTSSDAVYVTGDVSGSGVAGSVTVGNISEIGGPIVSRCNALGTDIKCCCCALGWGIMICNSNAITDDDFDVVLNGETIGQHEAREYSVKGEFWASDPSITKDALCNPDSPVLGDNELCGPTNFSCTDTAAYYGITCEPCAQSSEVSDKTVSADAFKQGANTLVMVNTNANYCEKDPDYLCANYGRVWVFQFCKDGDGEVRLSKILLSSSYEGMPGGSSSFSFSIGDPQVDDCPCKQTVYECDPNSGCKSTKDPKHTCFISSADCEAECLKRYQCASTGCQQDYEYTVRGPGFATESACADACLERFTCDVYSGCSSSGYALTGDTKTQCEAKCSPQSYTCDGGYYGGGGCTPRYDASGVYKTLTECQAVCLERAYCDTYWGCEYMGYGTSGMLYANCSTECKILTYDCDPYEQCKGRYNYSGGAYATLADCQASCLERYVCDYGSFSCQFNGYDKAGLTQAECSEDCKPQSYNCGTWGCEPIVDTSGQFSTSEACQAACVENYNCADYGWGLDCFWTGYQANGTTYFDCMANCAQPMRMPITTSEESNIKILDAFTKQNRRLLNADSAATIPAVLYVKQNSKPKPPATLDQQDPIGPGTFLSKTLEKIGIKSSPTCSCKARARIMNEKGNDWCAENVPVIVGWLREEAEKRKLPFVDIAGTLLVKRAISLSRAAKKKQTKNESTATDRADS